ncbi:tetratricopeptide repeat protein [Sedimentimonas flavescens]|uniref:tetratricopeptide repeat protein n=1 Tax=Sedimentimonas flavescens TaxID=2851012 RepID=UPI001C49EC00|nr:tetratricopeptide repeat protein [Sedimentimonas flavescens]MBW0159194.1 tetratricopeptide repeat protein [Sedimentimonas flavescens]
MPFSFSLRPLLLASLLGSALAAPVAADEAGPYLAARLAAGLNDYRAAAGYYAQLLHANPQNRELQESALIANVVLGNFDTSVQIAETMGAPEGGSQIAAMTLVAKAGRDEDYAALLALMDAGADPGPLLGGLVRAWALAGQGQMSDATKLFDDMAKQPGLGAFAAYHKALALAMVGDFEGADAIFSGKSGDQVSPTRRGVIAHVQILSQLERNADAITLLDSTFGTELDPELSEMRAALAAGETADFSMINSARDGVAEVYFTLGSALAGDAPDAFTLVHLRLAAMLRPDHADSILLTASLFEQIGRHDLAIDTYTLIPPDSLVFHAAELGRAEAMVQEERTDAAIEVLEQLTRSRPELAGVWTALGDTLRREERYKEAAVAYDKAINLLGEPQPGNWFVWYARAIAHERSDEWEKAEAGFREALKLSPDQPAVLNYLGYSYVERKENLDEALSMIERAVAARPDAGYIVDSLGWVLYRLGRYAEAVVQMERAVELEAVDPLVNDHLGDVYWAVGRKREAEFQWKRAISFGPGDDLDMDRVRRKLEVGLDKVLEEEGAEPLKPAQ